MDIGERLEAIQAWAWGLLGRDPLEVEALVDQLRGLKRKGVDDMVPPWVSNQDLNGYEPEDDPEKKTDMAETYRLFRTTRYQDPVILKGITYGFSGLIESAEKYCNVKSMKIRTPRIVTVPLMITNGFVLRDEQNEYGIVLQEGLRFGPMVLASLVGSILITPMNDGFTLNYDLGDLKAWLSRHNEKPHNLMIGLLSEVVDFGSLMLPQSQLDQIFKDPAGPIYAKISGGYKDFVLAHEYAHCTRGHLDQLEGKSEVGYICRTQGVCDRALSKMREKYSHLEYRLTEQQMFAFPHLHAMELDADNAGIKIVLLPILRHEAENNLDFISAVMGIFLFFWHIEILERIRRTIAVGTSWFEDDLYKLDIIVDDLLYRRTHPTPYSRFWLAKETMLELASRNDYLCTMIENIFCWTETLFENIWNEYRKEIADIIINLDCKIHPKCIVAVPGFGLMMGMANTDERA